MAWNLKKNFWVNLNLKTECDFLVLQEQVFTREHSSSFSLDAHNGNGDDKA